MYSQIHILKKQLLVENRAKKWKIVERYLSAIKLFGFYFAYLDGVLKGLNAMIIETVSADGPHGQRD